MSHRVSALYHDRDKARLAAGDLQFSGVPPERVVVADNLSEGSGRIEVFVRDRDQAIDVKTFLEEDGAHSVEIREGGDDEAPHPIPTVPAPSVYSISFRMR